MRLAMALGWSVQDIRNHMSCAEVQEWRAYNEIEPFGEERADLRAAIIAQTVADYLSGKSHKVEQFMPSFEEEPSDPGDPRQQSVEEMQAIIKPVFKETKERKAHGRPDGSCRLIDREKR